MLLGFAFWLYFDGDPMPISLYVHSFQELISVLEREVHKRGKNFEWLIRKY